MHDRRVFLTHFVLNLAFAALAALAIFGGFPQKVWAADQSYVTSVIAALFVLMMARIGWLAWHVGPDTDLSEGESAQFACVLLALAGTGLGLAFKLQSVASAASLSASGTALFSMVTGVVACAAFIPVNLNLEKGVRRARGGL